MARAYYNEIDPGAAAWLRELIKQGHIAPGDVDERDIQDVTPNDLRGYTQCHFFAGIGVWSHALRLAGWPDDRPVWTGSCPCQPFSAAGKRKGLADERHLWPAWHWLIQQCRPERVFGEQVASKDGLSWFDLVSTDLEASGYACGAVNLPACGVGAPHIRQRLWFVADPMSAGRAEGGTWTGNGQASSGRGFSGLGDTSSARSGRDTGTIPSPEGASSGAGQVARDIVDQLEFAGVLGVASGGGREGLGQESARLESVQANEGRRFWADAEWLYCKDGKFRPVEPGTFPLAHGAPARVGRLRGYGNAIVAQAAAEFIRAAS